MLKAIKYFLRGLGQLLSGQEDPPLWWVVMTIAVLVVLGLLLLVS